MLLMIRIDYDSLYLSIIVKILASTTKKVFAFFKKLMQLCQRINNKSQFKAF